MYLVTHYFLRNGPEKYNTSNFYIFFDSTLCYFPLELYTLKLINLLNIVGNSFKTNGYQIRRVISSFTYYVISQLACYSKY